MQSSDSDSDISTTEEPVHYYMTELKVPTKKFTKTSRKRLCTPNEWHRVKSKLARNMGKEYTNSQGRIMPAKKACINGNLCPDSCRKKCSGKFDSEERLKIFKAFYSSDENNKNIYLFHSIKPQQPKFQRLLALTHRTLSFEYYVTVGGRRINICKKAFLALHRITNSKIDHILQQIKAGHSSALPSDAKSIFSNKTGINNIIQQGQIVHIQMYTKGKYCSAVSEVENFQL